MNVCEVAMTNNTNLCVYRFERSIGFEFDVVREFNLMDDYVFLLEACPEST